MFEDPIFIVVANLSVAVLVRMLKPNLLTAGLLAIVLIASTGYLGKHHGNQVVMAVYRGQDAVLTWSGKPPAWPPEKNRTYPDLELVDQEGNVTRLSDFKGKVILVEPVGIPCQACVAFAGGHELGAFKGIEPQSDLESIESYAKRFGDVRLDDDRQLNQMTMHASFAVPDLARPTGDAWVMSFAPALGDAVVLPPRLQRRWPLGIPSFPSVHRYLVELTWPAGAAAIADGPATQRLETPHFRLKTTRDVRGNTETRSVEFEPRVREVPAAEVPRLAADLEQLARQIDGVMLSRNGGD